jgi:hypothetical protein
MVDETFNPYMVDLELLNDKAEKLISDAIKPCSLRNSEVNQLSATWQKIYDDPEEVEETGKLDNNSFVLEEDPEDDSTLTMTEEEKLAAYAYCLHDSLANSDFK